MRFYRRNDSYVGGVCGGLEDFTGIPAIVWRLAFLFVIPCAFWIYLAIWCFTESKNSL
jgi:phage shock protein PspC (stress-responsive transcriptional regulator)